MLKQAGIYVIANVLNAAIPFLLLPILTNYLSPAEYGIVAMFQVLTMALLPFFGFNFEAAIGRQFYDYDQKKFAIYVANGIILLLSSSLILSFMLFLTDEWIEKFSSYPATWVWALVIFSLFQKLTDAILTIWRVEQKPISFGLFRILRTILDLSLSLYLVVLMNRSWMGRIEGQLLAAVFFGSLAIYFLYKNKYLRFKYNEANIRDILRFGVPLIPHTIGAIIMTYSDRLFITNMIDLEEMGIYSVGYQVGMVIYLLQNSFNQAWQPWIYDKMKKDRSEDKKKMVIITYLTSAFFLASVVILTFISPYIFEYFIGQEFKNAAQFVFWIGLGFAFNGMYKLEVNYLFYLRKTQLIGLITISIAALNIVLNYFLIKLNGAVGAAQSTCICFLIQFVIVWFISSRYYKLPWLLRN